MKLVPKNESVQVLTDQGRLVVSYPNEAEARAFVIGYNSAVHEISDKVSLRTSELIREISAKL